MYLDFCFRIQNLNMIYLYRVSGFYSAEIVETNSLQTSMNIIPFSNYIVIVVTLSLVNKEKKHLCKAYYLLFSILDNFAFKYQLTSKYAVKAQTKTP